jgi:hypothetical protein
MGMCRPAFVCVSRLPGAERPLANERSSRPRVRLRWISLAPRRRARPSGHDQEMRAGAVSPGEVGRLGSTGGGRRAIRRRATPGAAPAARGSTARVRGGRARTRPARPASAVEEHCGRTCDPRPAIAVAPALETPRRRALLPTASSRRFAPVNARRSSLPRSPQRRPRASHRRPALGGQPARPKAQAPGLRRARGRKGGARMKPKGSGCLGVPGDQHPGFRPDR